MDIAAIEKIRSELESAVTGQKFGKIFQLSRFEIAIDFRLADSRYLFISIEPANPRVYLIRRRIKDLEKLSGNPSAFTVLLRKYLSGAILRGIGQVPAERILSFDFSVRDDFGEAKSYTLIAQLTGRSANLFLLDFTLHILESARDTSGDGQTPGDIFAPPFRSPKRTPENRDSSKDANVPKGSETLSEALDEYYLEKTAEARFRTLVNAARSKLKGEIAKNRRLAGKLNADLAGHGDAGQWKRFGDLLLANVANAKRDGNTILVTDYYDENLAEIAVPADKDKPITEAAEKYFKKYTKARNAAGEIAKRLKILDSEFKKLEFKKAEIDNAADTGDETFLKDYIAGGRKEPNERQRGKQAESGSGSRSFVSSDGFEILVGKKAKDNDFLTFRIAKSLDLWMHAADYPGSHVVVRNPNRKEIPPTTLLEAAQLAAFYSQGKSQPKAAVHYTQKKFVNKPKGAVPGLVSLASFKTILVEPEFPDLNESGRAKNGQLK